ncbi:MAG: fatty acid metabolism transcriptional regulator FadR [Chloroflexi bacterium]|nr:fatty acid metabolism transcriptional regulator FadR [Chloroflexota bacterium]
MTWDSPQKPAEIAESRLLQAILDGEFPINSNLPGERALAAQIGVTRPTLREALQRLARDGWLEIRHGKPTRVRDYWREGSLAVLAGLARSPNHGTPDFIAHLLEIRLLLAPTYTRQAMARARDAIIAQLKRADELDDDPASFARFDWDLHHLLTQQAHNPVFRLLLNSFESLYLLVGERYFSYEECRRHSQNFYAGLLSCAENNDLDGAERVARETMQESLALWRRLEELS